MPGTPVMSRLTSPQPGRIGVAISTRNRRDILLEALHNWRMLLPVGSPLVVVDDASDVPLTADGHRLLDNPNTRVIRHEYRRGIAMTKNRGIAELIDAGCEHLFLADDDVYPVHPQWWQPYVESPEPHLSYQWIRPAPGPHRWKVRHNDGQHWSIGFPRGVLLYAHHSVIDRVGGMDPAHGAWGGEHVEWSQRIHDAGLTTWPFADICGSDHCWFAHDKHHGNTVGSSFPLSERRRMAKANAAQWNKNGTRFVPYREGDGMQDYSLGPQLSDKMAGILQHVLSLHPHGTALEFGVGSGGTLRMIAATMPAIGFDSFEGLPEKWRDGFDVGMFACHPPQVPNATLVPGLFADTLPNFDWPDHIGLVHLDADLYSSTATVLEHLEPHLAPGCFIVFDEYHGYPGADGQHEQRAWREFAERTGIGWTVVGHGPEQWAVRLT